MIMSDGQFLQVFREPTENTMKLFS